VAQETLYFQCSPVGSSQPRCDLGRGEGDGENRLAANPSETRGEGERSQPSLGLQPRLHAVLPQSQKRLRGAGDIGGAGASRRDGPSQTGPAETPAAASALGLKIALPEQGGQCKETSSPVQPCSFPARHNESPRTVP